MDRNNLPNAAIAGMNADLGLTVGYRYVSIRSPAVADCVAQTMLTSMLVSQSVIALVFFITYTLCQPPGVIVMRFATPRIFLAGLCILWGIVMVSYPNLVWVSHTTFDRAC